MRLVTYAGPDGWRPAVVVGDSVMDVAALADAAGLASPGGWSARNVVSLDPDNRATLLAAAERCRPAALFADVRLGPPIPDPDKFIGLGANYRDHAAEAGMAVPTIPVLFPKFRNSLVGTGAQIVLPKMSAQVDYEGELAIVIGRRAKDVPADRALEYVFGGMVVNDVSARDLQHQTGQWLSGKALDSFAPCGPELVSLDEVGDVQNLRIRTYLNGEVVQDGSTADMVFSVADAVAFVSSLMTLEPGDIIATGTPAGVGVSRTPQVFLAAGDLVEVEVDGLGRLSNPVVSS